MRKNDAKALPSSGEGGANFLAAWKNCFLSETTCDLFVEKFTHSKQTSGDGDEIVTSHEFPNISIT
jgi:hypothetical protein